MSSKLSEKDLSIDFSHIDINRLMDSWYWLIGKDKTPILMTSIGDLFFSDEEGKFYWLDVGGGTFEKVAESISEFNKKLRDNHQIDEWFLLGLVERIKASGLKFKEGELFSYKKLPILGGEYEPHNFESKNIEVHFDLSGQIHKQIKDLPDGTKVEIVIKD